MDHRRGDLSTEGGRVVLRTDIGSLHLTAEEIYSLVTHGRSVHVELRRPAIETMVGTAFMSRPLTVFIWARNAAEVGLKIVGLKIDAAVSVRGQPEVLGDLVDDHVLSDDVWYPLDAELTGGGERLAPETESDDTSLAAYANIYRGLNQGVDRVGVWSELPVGKCVQSA